MGKIWVGGLAFVGGIWVGIQIAKQYANHQIVGSVNPLLQWAGINPDGTLGTIIDKTVLNQTTGSGNVKDIFQ